MVEMLKTVRTEAASNTQTSTSQHKAMTMTLAWKNSYWVITILMLKLSIIFGTAQYWHFNVRTFRIAIFISCKTKSTWI